jgi:hypothetical protein
MLALLNYADFGGRDDLLAQVPSARVIGGCRCGCASVALRVDRDPSAESVATPIPNEATVLDPEGSPIGGVLLFARDGCLAELEIYSFEDDPLRVFPPPDRLRLEREP